MPAKPEYGTYDRTVLIGGVPCQITINPRCVACGKVLAYYLAHPYAIRCPRMHCRTVNNAGAVVPAATGSDSPHEHDAAATASPRQQHA